MPHERPGDIRAGSQESVILQNQRVILLSHRAGQRRLLGLVKDDAAEVMIADPLEQLAALLHHRHNLHIQRGDRLTERFMRMHDAMKIIRTCLVDGSMDDIAGAVHRPGQRVGLARALASDPEVLLMDEPFSALDPLIRRQLQDQFMDLSRNLQKTTVFITHDLDEAIRIGHRIAIMKDGRIVQIGTPEEIVTQPADDYVRDFVEGISKLKLVYAHSIMVPIAQFKVASSDDLSQSPKAHHGCDLDRLIDISTTTEHPIVIQDDDGNDIGVIDKTTLLKGIQGGKA